jgi:acyl dehydratase
MSDLAAPDVNAVITDEVRSWIGRTTAPIWLPEPIGASDIRRYTDATGDKNPLWLDDAAARAAGYRARLVPPMMVIDLGWRIKSSDEGRLWHRIPLPPAYIDTRNADNEIEWLSEVYIDERLSIRHKITDIVARQGRRGLGVYITRETEFRAQDDRLVARVRQTVVRFPGARLETV